MYSIVQVQVQPYFALVQGSVLFFYLISSLPSLLTLQKLPSVIKRLRKTLSNRNCRDLKRINERRIRDEIAVQMESAPGAKPPAPGAGTPEPEAGTPFPGDGTPVAGITTPGAGTTTSALPGAYRMRSWSQRRQHIHHASKGPPSFAVIYVYLYIS